MRTIILLLAVVVAALITRALLRSSSTSLKQLGRWLLIVAVGGVLLVLLLTGRLHWLFALVAAAVPLLFRLLPLLRYAPFLRNLYQRFQAKKQNSDGPSSGQTSTVQSRFLRMALNLDSGDMDGEVLEGQFKGRSLSSLALEQLLMLLQECRVDQESTALLMAYLDRQHEDWRDQADAGQGAEHDDPGAVGSSNMTIKEACDILGVEPGASEQDVVTAHRRLMQKLHPDRGGSTYLAAKVNLAKELLLDRKH